MDVNKGGGIIKDAISNIDNFFTSNSLGKTIDKHTGLPSMVKGMSSYKGEGIGNRISAGAQKAGYITKNKAGELAGVDYGKIAKGYVAASAGARIATGGGLYKDSQGNTNVIGIPFI